MSTLKEANETFLEKQAQVYRADPNRIIRDARGARRAVQDYRGRWLLEPSLESTPLDSPKRLPLMT